MAVTVRLLLSRVKPFRPDLPDEYAMHGLRTAMAQIATRSFAVTVTDPCEVVLAGTYQSDWSNKNNYRTVRITRVEGISTYKIRTEVGISSPMRFLGMLDPVTLSPWPLVEEIGWTPPEPASHYGCYYIVSQDYYDEYSDKIIVYRGSPDVSHEVDPPSDLGWPHVFPAGAPPSRFVSGDIYYSDGVDWVLYKPHADEPTSSSVDAMAMIPQANKPSVEFKASNPQAGRDYLPQTWCQQDGGIIWMHPPKEDLIVRVTRCIDYGTASDLDMDTIEIPSDIESVMTDGALSYIYAIPGEHQDKNMAEAKRRQFEAGLASLRAMAIFGQGGSPRMQYSNFAGRRTF